VKSLLMMEVHLIDSFLRRYRFPLHLFQARDIITASVSLFVSTLSLRFRLSVLGCNYGKNLS